MPKKPQIAVKAERVVYTHMPSGTERLFYRPVIIGAGPAGLFCAYRLALNGYAPILLERGAAVEERVGIVDAFWKNGT